MRKRAPPAYAKAAMGRHLLITHASVLLLRRWRHHNLVHIHLLIVVNEILLCLLLSHHRQLKLAGGLGTEATLIHPDLIVLLCDYVFYLKEQAQCSEARVERLLIHKVNVLQLLET
jgi:hypothetical protein